MTTFAAVTFEEDQIPTSTVTGGTGPGGGDMRADRALPIDFLTWPASGSDLGVAAIAGGGVALS